jgi:putative intracellular protease/amidase
MRVVRSFFYRDLPVASVCHGIEIVTARTWHDNAPFMREFMKLLNQAASR